MASGAALLVIGFSETLTFEVASRGVGRDPSFVGVLIAVQASAPYSAPPLPPPSSVARRGYLAGAGIPWIVVALFRPLQRTTRGPLQGRSYSAVEVLVSTPQTVSIALGALLVAFVDYRLMLRLEAVVVAVAGAWLLARREQRVSTPV